MKNKSVIAIALVSLMTLTGFAQTNAPLFIKGNIDIKYNTRQAAKGTKGVQDNYSLNLNVANSALFRGTILDTPQIIDGWVNKTVVQARSLKFDIACDVVNPKNPSQTKPIGKILGGVPIASDGSYLYDKGNLEISVLPMGNAGGFTSKFTGITVGKPLVRPANWLETLQNQTVNITRSVNGKTMTVSLKKYDKMEFRQHILAAGPIQIYQPVTVNGEMLYDYDKECWFFNNITVQYADNNLVKIDRMTGTIRWDAAKNEYQFDIRVNEPPPSASAAFEAPSDESAFFESDKSVSALVGTMKYKDAKTASGVTLSSNVDVDLTGNNITKQQLMVLCKMIIFSSVVPMNAD